MSKHTIIAAFDAVLLNDGFRRVRNTWNRNSGQVLDVINLQKRSFDSMITVNAGVLHRVVHERSWLEPVPPFVDEAMCTVRLRIGRLIDGLDHWFEINDPETQNVLTTHLIHLVLPTLARHHSLEALEARLIAEGTRLGRYPPPHIYLAVIKSLLNRDSEAQAILHNLLTDLHEPWRTSPCGPRRISCGKVEFAGSFSVPWWAPGGVLNDQPKFTTTDEATVIREPAIPRKSAVLADPSKII